MSHADLPIVRLGHSPDPDDAFMWWPLFEIDGRPPRLNSGKFRFVPVTADIETLNRRSEVSAKRPPMAAGWTGDDRPSQGSASPSHHSTDAPPQPLEITAISCAQFPHVQDRYVLTACGASMGERYGPKLIAREALSLDDLRDTSLEIAVPGERTSAFAALSMLLGTGTFHHRVVPFEQIIGRVAAGDFAAGVVIHEGQLTYQSHGLHLIEDLGEWWWREHNLPMPLGVNVIRRDLDDIHGPGTLRTITDLLLRSVEYALAHREESIAYALGYARGLDPKLADEFVCMYVNKRTLDFGPTGRRAVKTFLDRMHEAGLCPAPQPLEFADASATGLEIR